jgi:enoyl-CoA hydratase/carnithine racemase
MDYETILVEIADKIATVTINRPDAMNSFNKAMVKEFEHLWPSLAHNGDVHCIVLRAAPGRAFSAGIDVKEDASLLAAESEPDQVWNFIDPGPFLGPKSMKCWKPLITAVHGITAGGAFYWVNESDIVIAADDAEFFDPHVCYGMVSAIEPIGMTYRMPLQDVLRMVLLGNSERMCAQTALRAGLVSEVMPFGQLWDRAHELARIIAAKPPAATAGSVRAIWESLDLPRSVALYNGVRYCQVGNPFGVAQVDREELMRKGKSFMTR